jgi:acyl carrier protein
MSESPLTKLYLFGKLYERLVSELKTSLTDHIDQIPSQAEVITFLNMHSDKTVDQLEEEFKTQIPMNKVSEEAKTRLRRIIQAMTELLGH